MSKRDMNEALTADLIQRAKDAKRAYLDALRNRDYNTIAPRSTEYTYAFERLQTHLGWNRTRTAGLIDLVAGDPDAENPS